MVTKQEMILLGFFLALLLLVVCVGGFLLFQQWFRLDSSVDYSSTLIAVLTNEAVNDEIATQVAVGLEQLTPNQQIEIENTPAPDEAGLVETPIPTDSAIDGYQKYYSQQGDTLKSVASRFQTSTGKIISYGNTSSAGFLPIDTILWVPESVLPVEKMEKLFPDAAIVNGPLDAGFDIEGYVRQANGYLSSYSENVRGTWMTGVEIIERVALEHSVSPKLLLALVEYQSGWVFSTDSSLKYVTYPLGYNVECCQGLYEELYIAGRQLELGYYGWREGGSITVKFNDGEIVALDPALNAGSAAFSKLRSTLYTHESWNKVVSAQSDFAALYRQMYGNPWLAVEQQPPLLPDDLEQPELVLPFQAGEDYHLTSGPHRSWGIGSPWAAVDFAPADALKGCIVSPYWITAAAAGLVVRSENGVVVIDLDGDGFEQTGWVLFYLHVSTQDRVSAGSLVNVDDQLGHASCEGGTSTGSHVHFARKYNGEWITAGGPIPMVVSGWTVVQDKAEYQGRLERGDALIFAYPYSIADSLIKRE